MLRAKLGGNSRQRERKGRRAVRKKRLVVGKLERRATIRALALLLYA